MDKVKNYKWPKGALLLCIGIMQTQSIYAQATSGSTVLNYSLIALAGILVVLAAMTIADNLFQMDGNMGGTQTKKSNFAIFPNFSEFRNNKMPDYAKGDSRQSFQQGFDLNIAGKPSNRVVQGVGRRFAVQPTNYRGIAPIPKVVVEVGDEVLAGDTLFYDKRQPEMKFVAPVSGEIVEINRGEKRAISEVVILADKEIRFADIPAFDLAGASREQIVEFLKSTGGWTLINQRPYDVIAEDITPVNIFISTFDTAPLAADLSLAVEGNESAFQAGLDVLARLTSGHVHLGLDGRTDHKPNNAFINATGVKKHWFSGAHPCGNVGVQIHHIDSIGRGEKIWTLTVEDVITLGGIFAHGRYNAKRTIALTGSAISDPQYISTYVGANIGDLLKNQQIAENSRIISGNVLTGTIKGSSQYLNNRDRQLSILPEGNTNRMFGWILPFSSSPSLSRTYPANHMFKNLVYQPNTNTNGEERGYVVTGEYERVLPMDIYPQHLIKAIKANDYEAMEGLGIYELTEEDVALCEYVCTSKVPVQQILRQGLDMMQDQE